jgi:hypothetical protein
MKRLAFDVLDLNVEYSLNDELAMASGKFLGWIK